MQERRQVPRWDVWQTARIKTGQSSCAGLIHDMNCKGMKVSLPLKLPEGPLIGLRIELSESVQLETRVNVRWQSHDRGAHVYGLSFAVLRDEDKDRIYQYLQSHCRQEWRKKLGADVGKTTAGSVEEDDPIRALDDLIDSFENEF